MRTLRVSLAIALILTVLLVKRHLNSIGSEWQRGYGADRAPEFVLNDDGAHIELVSKDQVPVLVDRPRSSSRALQPTTPTSHAHWEPTNPPPTQIKSQSETIPIWVPGVENEEMDDEMVSYLRDYMDYLNRDKKPKPKGTPKPDRIIVMGRTSWEDTSWVEDELPEWQQAVYVVDDPDAELRVQENKGKESNVYLQYIMDHYDKLPDYMVFLHAHRSSAHVEFMEQDNALTIQRLQLDYVKEAGYVNLRCEWGPGCPDEVQPFRQLDGRTTEIAFAGAWIRIFNNTDVPEVVAAPCCAQFAVTKERVLARSLSDYQNYHRWLMETELDDETSGRVFEYLWHIIFGQDAVSCPSKQQCYNDVYGVEYDPEWDWSAWSDVDWMNDDVGFGDASYMGDGDESMKGDDSSSIDDASFAHNHSPTVYHE